MSSAITRLLPLLLLFCAYSGNAGAQQRSPNLHPGDAVITGFSGTGDVDPRKPRPTDKSAADVTFINPDAPSARVIGLAQPGFAWDGRVFAAPKPFDVLAKDVGQVFGVALDDQAAPNIYLAATSAFGLNLVRRGANGQPERRKVGGPGIGWMDGQFGLGLQGDPGSIYRVDGATGEVSLFAKVMLDGVPNPGPALGNLAYDAAHKQLFASDLHTGMIHRFAIADGSEPGPAYDHGVTGRRAGKLEPMPFSGANRPNIASGRFNAEQPDSWGFAPPERRVWAVAVRDGRLFYSAMNGAAAAGPQIWSVGIAPDGSFAADARLEVEVSTQPGPYPVSDIAFAQNGAMLLAQRAPIAASYDYSAFTLTGEPRVLRYWPKNPNDPPSPGRWKPQADEYAIGFAGAYRNTNGGVALGYGYAQDGTLSAGACEASVWATGQNLRNNPALRSQIEPGGPLLVNGLQGSPADMVRSANEPPVVSYFVDYDDRFDDPRAAGHIGSVRILSQPCAGVVAVSDRRGSASSSSAMPPPGVRPPAACKPTCVCPDGTVLRNGECVKVEFSPRSPSPSAVRQPSAIAPPQLCQPPLVVGPTPGSCYCPPGGPTCTCPPGTVQDGNLCNPIPVQCQPPLVLGPNGTCVCPPGTVQQGRLCVPQVCPSPLVPGPCECPPGTVQQNGLCVPPPPPDKCPPPQVMNAAGECVCPPPLVPGPVPGSCICPDGVDCNTKPIDLQIDKTFKGGQRPQYTLQVTNAGAPISFPAGALTVTDTIPPGGGVGSVSATNWTCSAPPPVVTGPATITCTYNLAGSLGTGQQLPAIAFTSNNVTGSGSGLLVNCGVVSAAPSVGVDTNPTNDKSCVQLCRIQGTGPSPDCTCPDGSVIPPGGTCGMVLPTICPSPQVKNAAGECVTPQICPPPQVPNSEGTCACPAPSLPGPIPGSCVCPQGGILQDGICVPPTTTCPPPKVMKNGKCVTLERPQRREKRKPKRQEKGDRQERTTVPDRTPGTGIPGGFGGRGGGFPGGGGRGGGIQGGGGGRR